MTGLLRTFPLGVFVGGFRWSGSGAVSDWLAGHQGLSQPRDSSAAFGEVRALNYGLRYLAQTAARKTRWGERLGRWALCPDPALWAKVLGPPLSRERGLLSPIHLATDAAFTTAARFFIIPGLHAYKPLLDAQLGGDFRDDDEYLEIVSALAATLRDFMRADRNAAGARKDLREDDSVRRAASNLIGIMYRRLGVEGTIPIFDNAFSGLDPTLFRLISPALFTRKLFLLVRRDPRDQFADLVRYSGSTFSWSVGGFIAQYRRVQQRAADFLGKTAGEPSTLVKLFNFESFVLDTGGMRSSLKKELEDFWLPDDCAPKGAWLSGSFKPEESRRNIGFWKRAGLDNAMARIDRELPEYLVHEAEGDA